MRLLSLVFVVCVCWHGASVASSIASFVVSACMRRHNTALKTLNLNGIDVGAAGAAAIGEGLRYDVFLNSELLLHRIL